MSKARASIDAIEGFESKINEQKDVVKEITDSACGFMREAQSKISEEAKKVQQAIDEAYEATREAEHIASEIHDKMDAIENKLRVTPKSITVTETDENGNETTKTEPNPEYERLLSELNREIARLNSVEAIIEQIKAVKAEAEQNIQALEKARSITESACEQIKRLSNNWQQIAQDSAKMLRRASRKLKEYTKIKLDASGATGHSSASNKQHTDDNGVVYRVGNDLVKNGTYTINGYTYETDAQGRILSAGGRLRLRPGDRKTIKDTIQSIGRGSEHTGDDRGHIIGDRFDGSNGLENMFPQNYNLNRGEYNSFEGMLADAVAQGKEVYVKVDLLYGTNTNRPTQVLAIYSIDGRQQLRFFDNN